LESDNGDYLLEVELEENSHKGKLVLYEKGVPDTKMWISDNTDLATSAIITVTGFNILRIFLPASQEAGNRIAFMFLNTNFRMLECFNCWAQTVQPWSGLLP
jgi:hypothetical protein